MPARAAAQELPLKSIELEWESVPNAFGYEVRMTPKTGGKPLTWKTLENKLAVDVPVGVYILRVRSRHQDAEDHWSAWSDPILFEVLTKEMLLLSPGDGEVLKASGDLREEVTFRWVKIDKARDYVLKIWTEETIDHPLTFITQKPSQRLKLLPGRVYFWEVTFESATRTTYAQKVHPSTFTLQGKKLVQPSIKPPAAGAEIKELAWVNSPRAKAYAVKLMYRHLDEIKWTPVSESEIESSPWPVQKLAPGYYRFEILAKAPRFTNSDVSATEFAIKPSQDELQKALALSR